MMKISKGIISFILCIVLILITALSVFVFSLHNMTDVEKISDELMDVNVTELMCDNVRDAVKTKTINLVIGEESFEETVSDDEIILCARKYIRNIVGHMLYGEKLTTPEFESDKLYLQIERELEAYAEENGLAIEDGSVDAIYTTLCTIVSAKVTILSNNYINQLPTAENYTEYLKYYPMLVVVVILIALIVVFLNDKYFLFGLYYSLTSMWTGTAMVLIPFMIVRSYDIPSRIAISKSPLKEFIRNVIEALFTRVINISAIVIIVLSCLLFVVITLIAATRKSKKSSDTHNDSDSSEHHRSHKEGKKSTTDSHKSTAHGGLGITEEDIDNFIE